MSEIEMQITAEGGVQMLHDDAVDLGQLGEPTVERASHVEYSDGKTLIKLANESVTLLARGWYVQSAKTLEILWHGLPTRAMALAWEKSYYSPTGLGWSELTEGN